MKTKNHNVIFYDFFLSIRFDFNDSKMNTSLSNKRQIIRISIKHVIRNILTYVRYK